MANEHLRFQLRELRPVSLDGIEGRKWQFETIDAALKEAWSSQILQARYRGMNIDLFKQWHDVGNRKNNKLTIELMNEFANVIDAEYIRRGEEGGDKYVKRSARPVWLMKLPNDIDRQFVLHIHSIYKKYLLEMNALSVDEMVADFNQFLDSNAWEREKKWSGYDAVFVDELHLFTSLEKQTLQKLVRRKVSPEGVPDRPAIFMAYDLKQSPRDSFIDYFALDGSVFSSRSGLQNSDLVQLNKVFRYTPQIAEFLRDVDAAFPAIDVPGEWDAYVGDAELPDSDKPELISFNNDVVLLDQIFTLASKVARRIDGGGRRVAVLCVSEEVFNLYLPPALGRYSSNCFVVDSREATAELRHVGKRFVFSMPEFVAGLQFDTVFLIHVNQSEAPEMAGIGRRRQLISNTYLGASRAENKLIVCSCESRGGASDILSMALDRGSLVE